MSKKQNRSFYYGSGVSVKIDDYLLRIFLTEEGFSQFQQTSERLGKKQFIKNGSRTLGHSQRPLECTRMSPNTPWHIVCQRTWRGERRWDWYLTVTPKK